MTAPVTYKFRLYVAGSSQNSAEALVNLHDICDRCLRHRHDIEIVDVNKEPHRALADGIRMTPSLIKLSPSPIRRIVGTLAHTRRVQRALDLPDVPLAAELD